MASQLLSWSTLPEELLAMIKNRLFEFPGDYCRFRSVCSSWRSSTPPFKISLPFPDVLIDNSGESRNLNHISIYSIEPLINQTPSSPTPFVIGVQFLADKLYYVDPLSSLRTHPNSHTRLPKELNLGDFRITELQKFYGTTELRKVVFISSTHSTQHYDETILAIFTFSEDLVFYKLEDSQWVVVKVIPEEIMKFSDIILYEGRVWGVLNDGRTVVFTSDLVAVETTPSLFADLGRTTYFQLIESRGDLFVVEFGVDYRIQTSIFDEMIPMKIHKLVVEANKFVEVRDLDDRVFVLALDFPWSFWVPSVLSPGGMKSCIVCSATSSDFSETGDCPVCMSYSVWDTKIDNHKILGYGCLELFWSAPDCLMTGSPSD